MRMRSRLLVQVLPGANGRRCFLTHGCLLFIGRQWIVICHAGYALGDGGGRSRIRVLVPLIATASVVAQSRFSRRMADAAVGLWTPTATAVAPTRS